MDCNHLIQAVGLLAVCPAVTCSTPETYLLLLGNPGQAVCMPSWAEALWPHMDTEPRLGSCVNGSSRGQDAEGRPVSQPATKIS